MKINKHIKTFLCSAALLVNGCSVATIILEYIMCYYRTDFIFEITIFMLFFITIAAILKLQKLVICPAIGYNLGYILGFIFNIEYYDEGGTPLTTWWHWLIIVVFLSIIAGIAWEIISRIKQSKSK